ncbi:hypothetical protein I302_106550 [Kwoniella bestiolae CBS 10118]|uniref:Uncharacterized protein n=1 Tax=Kwoniella bestiolae CBS 10118 TaxID=1296100 RepID=A0A1B9G132_9TREE|nr:hypothetical protein I302_06188 [Kwoniella bestiolae CBS 10118]OCF24727.1 hypothetical protein I302_06188 [Kwoniella bestiolae CBS 10118]
MSSSAVDNEIKTELSSAYNSYQEVLSKITDRLAKSAQVPEYIQMFERHPSYHRSPLIPTWQDSYCRGPGEELIDRRERFKALLKDTPFPPKTEELPSTPIVEPVDDERSPNDSAASFMVGARNDSESISGDSTAPSEEGHEQHDSGVNIGEHSDFETIPNGSTATLEEGHEPLNSWVNIGDHSDSETISNGSTTPLEESHEHLDSGFDIADHSHSETIVNDPTPSAASEEQQEQLHFCDRYSGRR